MRANNILLQKKYTRIISLFAETQNLSIEDALEYFYHSFVYQEISKGISDMHCRSDEYLAEELNRELTGH